MKKRNPYLFLIIVALFLLSYFLYNFFAKAEPHVRAKKAFYSGNINSAINILEKENDIVSEICLSNILFLKRDSTKALELLKKWEGDSLIGIFLKKKRLNILLKQKDTTLCLSNFNKLNDSIKNLDIFSKFNKLNSKIISTNKKKRKYITEKNSIVLDSINNLFKLRIDSLIPLYYKKNKQKLSREEYKKVFLIALRSSIRNKNYRFIDSLAMDFKKIRFKTLHRQTKKTNKYRAELLYRFGDVYEDIQKFNKASDYFNKIISKTNDTTWAKIALRRIILLKYREKHYGVALKHIENLKVMCDSSTDNSLLLFLDYWTAKIHYNSKSYSYSKELVEKIIKRDYDGYYGFRAFLFLDKLKEKGIKNINTHISITDINQSFPAIMQLLPKEFSIKQIETLLQVGLYLDAYTCINKYLDNLKYIKSLQLSSAFQFAKLCDNNGSYLISRKLLNKYFYKFHHDHYSAPQEFFELLYPRPFNEIIITTADKWDFSVNEIYSLIKQESSFLVNARSYVGAMGLTQLMPATAKDMEQIHNIGFRDTNDLYIPSISIPLGISFLAKCKKEFNGIPEFYIPSYNAGIDKVNEWKIRYKDMEADLFVEYIPYKESRNFTKLVLRNIHAYGIVYN